MLLCVIFAASSMSVSAKKWRMFTDVNLGSGVTSYYDDTVENSFSGMLLLSGGYQHQKCFLGLGCGLIFDVEEVTSFPFYAHIRYDFFKEDPKSFSPFVSLRIGYNIANKANGSHTGDGIIFLPSAGFRKGLTENIGLNLGASAGIYGKTRDVVDFSSTTCWGVFINVGLDF